VSEWNKISVDCCVSGISIMCDILLHSDTLYWLHWNKSTDILFHSDTLYWLHWNNSLQISCSTLTHYTDSTETSLQISCSTLTHFTDSTETTVYRNLAPLWHIILIPLKQQSTDILLHSDTLYWFHWNNSLHISCSTLTHYTDSTETTVYRYLAPFWLLWNNSLQLSCTSGARYL
jgi:hypothetical protein